MAGTDGVCIFLGQHSTANNDLAAAYSMQGLDGLFHSTYGGSHKGGQTNDLSLGFLGRLYNGLHRHILAQIDNLVAVVF